MAKIVDKKNGFITYTGNIISKVGVFPYYGFQIDDSLIPDRVYGVLRPLEELSKKETLESFEQMPLLDGHEMIGKDGTPYDKRQASGTLYNIRMDGDNLIGDIKVFSEKVNEKIAKGNKELSCGYRCDYFLQKGTYKGKVYDAIQRNIIGNHIARVDKARCGSDVKVQDEKTNINTQRIVMDSMIMNDDEENTETTQDEFVDMRAIESVISKSTLSASQKESLLSDFSKEKYSRNSEEEKKGKPTRKIEMPVGKSKSSGDGCGADDKQTKENKTMEENKKENGTADEQATKLAESIRESLKDKVQDEDMKSVIDSILEAVKNLSESSKKEETKDEDKKEDEKPEEKKEETKDENSEKKDEGAEKKKEGMDSALIGEIVKKAVADALASKEKPKGITSWIPKATMDSGISTSQSVVAKMVGGK